MPLLQLQLGYLEKLSDGLLQWINLLMMLDDYKTGSWWKRCLESNSMLDLFNKECFCVSWFEFNSTSLDSIWRVSGYRRCEIILRRRKVPKLFSRLHSKRSLSLHRLERYEDEVCFCKNHPRTSFEFFVWIPNFPFLNILRFVWPSKTCFYHLYTWLLILRSS